MIWPTLALAVLFMAWAVRGKSSPVFGPGIWRGPSGRRALALTFDDGPSDFTPELLRLLAEHGAHATFFLCGEAVRRFPGHARAIRDAGHEIGNHTEHHARLWLRSASFIEDELRAAQASLREVLGSTPGLFRPTYGVRWFGLARAERRLGLTRVMWSAIGRDWKLDAAGVARRLKRATHPGAILLLHDGPHAASTPGALRELLPWWEQQGYTLVTVSKLTGRDAPSTL
jgi:peptidoglycan/xylan/chitin deacetylase (PgdA/CDA1 family)